MKEWYRQAGHLVFVLLLLLVSLFVEAHWFALICAVLFLVGALLLAIPNPVIPFLFKHMERDHHKKFFPGKGALAIVVGPLVTALIFPAQLTPALLVLAFADAVSTVVGKHFGKRALPWSPKKTWAGTVAFFITSSVILVFYSPLWAVGALVLTALESVDYSKILFLDDNIIIPLATGALLILI